MAASFDADLPSDIAPDFSAFYRRLQDISGYQLDRLRNATSTALLRDYENELSEAFSDVETRLKALQLATEDYDRPNEVNAVKFEAERASRELQQTRQASREALLATRRGLAARSEAQARAELNLGQGQGSSRERSKLADRSSDDKLQTASEDVTSALQRTVALMSQELEKSTFSAQMLDESSSSLRTISLEYTSFSSLVKSSTQLIKSMERQDLYDRLMVFASLAFFLLCVAYIFKVRVWDRGVSVVAFFLRSLTLGLGGRSKSAEHLIASMKIVKSAAKETVTNLAVSASASASVSASLLSQSIAAAASAAVVTASAAAVSGTSVAASIASQVADSAQIQQSEQPSQSQPLEPSGNQNSNQDGDAQQREQQEGTSTSSAARINIADKLTPKQMGERKNNRPTERREL